MRERTRSAAPEQKEALGAPSSGAAPGAAGGRKRTLCSSGRESAQENTESKGAEEIKVLINGR